MAVVGRCCYCIIRFLLIFLNAVFIVAGLGILAGGAMLMQKRGDILQIPESVIPLEIWQDLDVGQTESLLFQAGIALIALGLFVFLVGFMGLCGAFTEKGMLLMCYLFFVILILTVEVSALVAALILKNRFNSYFADELKDFLSSYNNTQGGMLLNDENGEVSLGIEPKKILLDGVQIWLGCCGVESPEDYVKNNFNGLNEAKVPVSCCKFISKELKADLKSYEANATKCLMDQDGNHTYTQGCFDKVKDMIVAQWRIIAIVGCSILLVEVSAIVITCCVVDSVRKDSDTDLHTYDDDRFRVQQLTQRSLGK